MAAFSGYSFSQILKDVTPIVKALAPVANAAGDYFATKQNADERSQTSDNYSRDLVESSNIVNTAYDNKLAERVKGYDELTGLSKDRLNASNTTLDDAIAQYLAGLQGNVTDYGSAVRPAYDEYTGAIRNSMGAYRDDLSSAESKSNATLLATQKDIEEMYAQQRAAGESALSAQEQLLAADPAQLTPSQQIVRDKLIRDAQRSQMASGLRGAGRAGLASINTAIGRQDANFLDQNTRRQDSVISSLAATGVAANNAVANQANSTGAKIAQSALTVGGNQATADLQARQNLATNRNNFETQLAGKAYDATAAGAAEKYKVGQNKVNLLSDYYGNMSDIASSKASDSGDAVFGKGLSTASTTQAVAKNNLATDNANRQETSASLGNLATVLQNTAKDVIFNKANSNTANGKA